jgi:hypothetical protein
MPEPTPKELVARLESQQRALIAWAQASRDQHQDQMTLLALLVDAMRKTLAELEARLP